MRSCACSLEIVSFVSMILCSELGMYARAPYILGNSLRDFPMVLGKLVEHIVQVKKKKPAYFVVNTTGDTGGSAIQAIEGKNGLHCFVLYPRFPRVSRIQELQMISSTSPNIRTIATVTDADENDIALRSVLEDKKQLN